MHHLTRRRVVSTGATIAAAALAGCGTSSQDGGGDGGDGVPDAIDDHLDGANGYDGEIDDRTGRAQVTVDVGAGDGLAFDPAAVRVDAGTQVVWEWTGMGGSHNVSASADSDTDFMSETTNEAGTTFEETFDDAGHQLYQCDPHARNGMLGAVDVVED